MACTYYECRECQHGWHSNGAGECPECGGHQVVSWFDEDRDETETEE